PSNAGKQVRKGSCRSATWRSARSSASASKGPASGMIVGMLYAAEPGDKRSAIHSRCCANDNGFCATSRLRFSAGSAAMRSISIVTCERAVFGETAMLLSALFQHRQLILQTHGHAFPDDRRAVAGLTVVAQPLHCHRKSTHCWILEEN